jgi:Arc/MetJ family transcription regulator
MYRNIVEKEDLMRTTLNLSDALVAEAMSLTKIHTKTAMVKFALENIIRQEKIKGLSDYFGKLDLDIDLDKLRNR